MAIRSLPSIFNAKSSCGPGAALFVAIDMGWFRVCPLFSEFATSRS